MKKYLSIIFCFAICSAYSQTPSTEQKKQSFKVVDELVNNYMQYSKINDPSTIQAFKQLFAKDATIPNEIIPAYFYNNKKQPEKILSVSVADYLAKLNEVYPKGYDFVKFLNSAISYKNISKKEVKVIFQKNISAYTNTGLQLEVIDTVQLNIVLAADYTSAAIAKIDLLGTSLKLVNDDDKDFVSNDNDKCKTVRGLYTLDGCYTVQEQQYIDSVVMAKAKIHKDSLEYVSKIKSLNSESITLTKLAATPPHWWVNIGVAGGSVSSTISGENAYKADVVKANTIPTSTFKSGNFMQFNVGLNYFFGAKANFGIGLGLNYNNISGNVAKDSFHVEYKEKDKSGSDFTQLVSSRGAITEKVGITELSIPITLIYKGDFSKKMGFNIEAGILYNLSYNSTTSSTNSMFDLEAQYLFSGSAANGGNYYDAINPSEKTSWLITRKQAIANGATDGGTAYLNTMEGYGFYVGASKTATKSTTISNFQSGSIGFIIKPSLSYHFNNTASINAGIVFTSTTFNQTTNTYRVFDKTQNSLNYNTLLNGVNTMANSNIGVHISFTKALFYNVAKWKSSLEKVNTDLMDYQNKLNTLKKAN